MSANPSGIETLRQRDPEKLLQFLEWRVIRRLDGLLKGDYRTLFYGDGVDFADLREYQLQDDIRYIDWNVSARMNSLYIRQFVEDREVTAWFFLDLSPSMGFGSVGNTKAGLQRDLVMVLARLLTRSGNRVGAILLEDAATTVIKPRTGRNQVLRLTHELTRDRPAHSTTMTDLQLLFGAGLQVLKRRSLVFIVSDFISVPDWQRTLSLLSRRHELIALRLWDPREIELPDAGLIVVEDSETGEQLFVDSGDPRFRQRFYDLAERRTAALQDDLRTAGVDDFSISTEDDLVVALVRIAGLRKKQRILA